MWKLRCTGKTLRFVLSLITFKLNTILLNQIGLKDTKTTIEMSRLKQKITKMKLENEKYGLDIA